MNIVVNVRDSREDDFVHMNFDYRMLIESQKKILDSFKAFLPRVVKQRIKSMIKSGDVYLMQVFIQFKTMMINFREFLSEIMTYFSAEETIIHSIATKPEKDYLKRFEVKKNISEEEFHKIMSILPNLPFKDRRWVEKILIKNEDPYFQKMLENIQLDRL